MLPFQSPSSAELHHVFHAHYLSTSFQIYDNIQAESPACLRQHRQPIQKSLPLPNLVSAYLNLKTVKSRLLDWLSTFRVIALKIQDSWTHVINGGDRV